MTEQIKHITDILNNPQGHLKQPNTLLFLLENCDNEGVGGEPDGGGSALRVAIKTYSAESPEWIRDMSLEEFVKTFPVSEEYPSPKPDWFVRDQTHRELRRASNVIGMTSNRGPAKHVYHAPGAIKGPIFSQHHDATPYTQHHVDFVPEGYALLMYEGSGALDVGFIYTPGFGILANKNYQDYGRLVKIHAT